MTPEPTDGISLSRDAVVAAALPLLDEVGIDGLSMRALADRLGVKAASLYWHLRDKQQLLEMLAEAVLDAVEVPVSTAPWRGQVESACERLAASLRDRPAAAVVVLGALPVAQRSRLVRDLARVLATAGVDDAESAALGLVVDVVAAAATVPAMPAGQPAGRPMTLAIDSGSWRVSVRAGSAGMAEVATSTGGGGAASLDIEDDRVIVRNRRGGNRGSVELNPHYTWHVKVHGGTWNSALDLGGLRIGSVELDSGAGNVTCTLPSPLGVVPITVHSGIVNVALRRPHGVAAVATVKSGSVKVRFDEQNVRSVSSDVHWETTGGSREPNRYDVTVHSGCVRVAMDDDAAPSGPPPAPIAPPSAPASASTPPEPPRELAVGLILDGVEGRLSERHPAG